MKILKNRIIILISIFFLILIYFFNLIIIRPFPFFQVEYHKSLEKFNVSPYEDKLNFYKIDINKNNISERIRKILDEYIDKEIYEKIKISTEITRKLQENSYGKEVKNLTNIFEGEQKYLEICSESSKIFVTLMTYFNVYSRVIWANGHTVAEVWNGENWIMTDTLSNIYSYSEKDGKYLSFSETVNLFPNVKFKEITNSKYDLYEYKANKDTFHNILKNNNLIFVMSNRDIYSFNTFEKKISRVKSSISINPTFPAKQFLNSTTSKKVGNVGLRIYKRFFY